jgi:hypothetical protein
MNAFVRKNGVLFKAYRDGADWYVTRSDKPESKRYFSVWAADVEASLYRAIADVSGASFNEIQLT